jgi:acyl phosphate:glycerol-3-phosphate acyltransferase
VPALVFSLTVSPLAGVLAGAGAMVGHARPLFLKFERGGKMVATCGGAFLGVAPIVGGIGLAVWIVVFLLGRYASLASIVAALSLPVAAGALGYSWPVIVFAALAAGAVILLHRANIKRLFAGTENRFVLRRPRNA